VDFGSEYTPESISACYGNKFKCHSIDVSLYNNVDTSKLGDYEVIYSVAHGKNKKDIVRKVTVVDRVDPVIKSSDSLSLCPNSNNYDIDYSATDNYDGDITDKVSKDVFDDKLILSVSDSSNNNVSKVIDLKREDVTLPSISLNGDETVFIPVGTDFADPGYSAYDNCDGDITDKVSVSGNVGNSSGNYSINYSVSDDHGNTFSLKRNIVVYSPNNNGNKVIYLTFDDGPSQYTGELLDALSKYNVKATFFVTGRNSNYFHYIKRAYDEGHTIGLHTYSHNYSLVYSSIDAYFSDLNSINEIVREQTGSYSNIIRFPGGSSNTVSRNYTVGIMSQLSSLVESKGYKYFDWNVSSGDASSVILDSSSYAQNVINGLGNGSYYVVLQHDTNVNSIRAVSNIIEYGLSHGYSFRAIDINSPTVHHRIAN
jgi:peptidoglycan/xylan/chitin deacetylase (PgdA/CDA1 family)